MKTQVSDYTLVITKKGFTLTEILVAVTILTIAVAAIYTSFKGGLTSWTKGTARMERYLNARAALDMMSRELSAALIVAVSSTYAIDFVYSNDSEVTLRFATAMYRDEEANLVEVAYDYNSSTKEVRRAIDANANFPYDKSKSSPSGFTFNPLCSNVNSLEFELWDGSSWRSDWDSRTAAETGGISATRDLLPKGVKITITVQDELQQEEEQIFSTTVYLPAGG